MVTMVKKLMFISDATIIFFTTSKPKKKIETITFGGLMVQF